MDEEVIQTRFEVVETLAKGLYTTVSLVREKNSGLEFALKALHIEAYPSNNIDRLMWEVRFHERVAHPNIIKKLESFQVGKTVFVLMEFAEKGDLFGFFWKHRNSFNEAMIRRILFQVAQGVHAIHQAGLLHRDLKPENILLDHDLNVKLCDFGWSCEIEDEDTNCERAGTLAFMSPEALEGKKQDKYSDVWSFGMLIYEMYHGSEAFDGEDKQSRLQSIFSSEVVFSGAFPKDIADLFYKCSHIIPERRIKFCDIISHPAFNQFHLHHPLVESSSSDIKEKQLSANKAYAPLLSSSHLRRKTTDTGISAEGSKDSTPIKAKRTFLEKHTKNPIGDNERSTGFLKYSMLKRACSPVFKPLSLGPKPSSHSEKTSIEKFSFHPPSKTLQADDSTVYLSSSLFLGKSRDEKSLEIPMTGLVHGRPGAAQDGTAGAYDPLRMLSNFSTTMNSHYALFERASQESQQHRAVRVAVPTIEKIKDKTKPKSLNTFMANYKNGISHPGKAPGDSQPAVQSISSPSQPVPQSYLTTAARIFDNHYHKGLQESVHYRNLSGRIRKDSPSTHLQDKKMVFAAPVQAEQSRWKGSRFESKVDRAEQRLGFMKKEFSESLADRMSHLVPETCVKSKWALLESKHTTEGFEAKLSTMRKPLKMNRNDPEPRSGQLTAVSALKKSHPAYSSLLKLSARHRDSSQQLSGLQSVQKALEAGARRVVQRKETPQQRPEAKHQAVRSATSED